MQQSLQLSLEKGYGDVALLLIDEGWPI